jgi:hypothetical protein
LSACGRKIGCSRTHEGTVNWFYRFPVEQGFELQLERVGFTEIIIYHPAQPTTPVVVAPTKPVVVEDFSVGQPSATHAARQASVALPAENPAVEAEAILVILVHVGCVSFFTRQAFVLFPNLDSA